MPAKDRHDFELSMKNMDWAEYMRHFTDGLRPMMTKDGAAPAKTEVVQARRRLTYIMYARRRRLGPPNPVALV